MKAIVLCAGEGTRLRPLTYSKPKHLLPVGGEPLLGHVLQAIAAVGLREVGIVVGYLAEAIRGYVGDGARWGLHVTYIHQEQPLGLGHAVKQAEVFVGGEPFLVYLGDNILGEGLQAFLEDFARYNGEAALMLKAVADPRRYGVAVLDSGGRVQAVVEKPAEPPSPLAIVGVYAFQPSIFSAIDSLRPSARGELEITDAIQKLIEAGRVVRGYVVTEFWEDAGEPLSLLVANRYLLDQCREPLPALEDENIRRGYGRIGFGTRLKNCILEGPLLVGNNCELVDCRIGPYVSIGDGCQIRDSQIENSIIQPQCQITGVALQQSVLGEKVHIVGGAGWKVPLHVILGDMAQIRML